MITTVITTLIMTVSLWQTCHMSNAVTWTCLSCQTVEYAGIVVCSPFNSSLDFFVLVFEEFFASEQSQLHCLHLSTGLNKYRKITMAWSI